MRSTSTSSTTFSPHNSVSIKWAVDSRGRIKLESKDDMRKRGMPSPDRADTLAMVVSRRATGGSSIDIESHRGGSITGDLMTKAW